MNQSKNYSTKCVRVSKKIVLTALLVLNTSNIQSMEEERKGDRETINTYMCQPAENINDKNDSSFMQEKDIFHGPQCKLHSILNFNVPKIPKLEIENILANNNVLYNSKEHVICNVVKNREKKPNNYKAQKLEGINIIADKNVNTKEREQYLFNMDDNDLINQNNIENIKNEIRGIVNGRILKRGNHYDVVYYNNSTEEKVNCLSDELLNYWYHNAESILNNNCSANKYECNKTYIPFKILQIMYQSISKYDSDIAEKTINRVYNENKNEVYNYFKKISNKPDFDLDIQKKNNGFLGSYAFNKIPGTKELDELKGKELADYWEYANHSIKMFPSINMNYTNEYLKEAYNKYSDAIIYDLGKIIEKTSTNNPIDNILQYYARIANRSPNVYLSNDVIDFIHKKLKINNVIYFIDKFINIKQQHLTDEDLPKNNADFPVIFNEYPNGNIKDYSINVHTANCVACIFNSSDRYNDVAGANGIIVDNKKENLYNRLTDDNMSFNPKKNWHINKYSKFNNDGHKSYNTVFLYYTK